MFLDDIYQAYKRNPALQNLMVDPEFAQKLVASEQAWRSVVTKARACTLRMPDAMLNHCRKLLACKSILEPALV